MWKCQHRVVFPVVKAAKIVTVLDRTLLRIEELLNVRLAVTSALYTSNTNHERHGENKKNDLLPEKECPPPEEQNSGKKSGKDIAICKYNLIQKMNFKAIEHSLPFYNLPVKELMAIVHTTISDKNQKFCENRLYYLSDKLQYDPTKLSRIFCKRTLIYTQISFPRLESSLKVLLEMGVPGSRIVRDLWVLKYRHERIRYRLQRVLDTGRKDLAPWMVRCSEEILQKSLEISSSTKTILGDKENVHIYLAERLKTTANEVEEMCVKTPYLKTIRVTKVKNSLDYLFSEGFTEEDIISVPRILANSVRTIKTRAHLLKNSGIDIKGRLNLLSKSNKDFEVSYDCIKKNMNPL